MSDVPHCTERLRLGFLLFEYFPFGGLQRDCLKTALESASRGHEVTLFTRTWEGPRPEAIRLECLGRTGWTNVARNRNWCRQLRSLLPDRHLDGLIGFNKLPGLDVYFGADPCYVAKMKRLRPAWHRFLPRYRHYAALEKSVFARGQPTRILLLTDHEIPLYREIYGTEPERFTVLPPGIARSDRDAATRQAARRNLRREHGWDEDARLLLLVGSGFRIKGLDRAIHSLAALPETVRSRTQLAVIGRGSPGAFAGQARRLGVADRVHFLGARSDVPDWLCAADLLVHPAYNESAGMILLEALTMGLPVLTTDTCGYAGHIARAQAGKVLASPFEQETCNKVLAEMLTSRERARWRANGLGYAGSEDLYSCHREAVDRIEAVIRRTLPRSRLGQTGAAC